MRSWELRKGSTICLQCPMGCSAVSDTHKGKVLTDHGDFEAPANTGALCKVGRFNDNFVNTPHRLQGAFVRDPSGEQASAPIHAALDLAAAKLAEVVEKHGGSGVGIVAGGMLTNEEYYLLQNWRAAPWAPTIWAAWPGRGTCRSMKG